MTNLLRQEITVPLGQRVLVVADFDLTPESSVQSRVLQQFTRLLDEIDDACLVIIAGNLLRPADANGIDTFLLNTLIRLPDFKDALERFTRRDGHRLLFLPGEHDLGIATSPEAIGILNGLGIEVASDVLLHLETVSGSRELAVVAGVTNIDLKRADPSDRLDAGRVEDPLAMARFVHSRVLYRRLKGWLWLPFLVLLFVDFWSTITAVVTHFTHHHFKNRHFYDHNFWTNLIVNLFLLVLVEAIVAGSASMLVRHRFDREARRSRAPELCEPLALTSVDGVDALEVARRIADAGGSGAIVGGAPRPALAFLDRGVCASPGPSRAVVIERHGRFGMPPVFTTVERLGVVEIEAASAVHVRLLGSELDSPKTTLLERIAAGSPMQPNPTATFSRIGSWPNGEPFPVTLERIKDQRHRRAIRRWASGLLFLEGLIDVIVTAVPPLRGRLHAVLTILPLSAAQSAAAFTAVAGVTMIMTARGVRRGQRRAWYLAVITLSVTIVTHLLRGGSLVASILALSLMMFLVIERRYFQATADRSSARAAYPRLFMVGFVAVCAATFGAEATSHGQLPSIGVVFMACVERLVGQTNIYLPDRAGDLVTTSLGAVGIALLTSTLYLFTRPVVDRRLSTAARSTDRRLAEVRAREIVRRHGRGTLDYFALRDDKQFFFFRDSMVAYAVYGGVALVSPDPIGPVAERTEVFSAFRTYAESRGWTIGVMGASEAWLPVYQAAGLHYLYLGDEAIVDVQTFSLEGGKMKGLRQATTRIERNGYTAEFMDPSEIDPRLVPDLMHLITKLRRGEAERGFSMMLGRLFNPKDKGLLLTVVFDAEHKPAAVCQFVPSPAIKGYSLDLMRRDPGDHPNGLMDYALCQTIAYLREQGATGLSLNFATFRSVLDGEAGDGAFTRVERWALRRLSGILPIESLWTFNAKYYPKWMPRHLVYPAAESFVPVVAATLRAESITEIPLLGRLLSNDPSNRPGTVIPEEVLAAARHAEGEN